MANPVPALVESPRSWPCLPAGIQAQTQVWSAHADRKQSAAGVLGCSNGFPNNPCSVGLSDDDFTHDSGDYAIIIVWLRSTGRLDFSFVSLTGTTASQAQTLTPVWSTTIDGGGRHG